MQSVMIKIGTSSLCDDLGVLSLEKMMHLVVQIVEIQRRGIKVTLVSSGAIGAGMGVLALKEKPTQMKQKQALAAIGQAHLMKAYEDVFKIFECHCAQILVNHDDFDDRKRLMNLTNALESIHEYGAIAIINENDTLATDEIKVGDNDTLAALMAPIVKADLLIITSDIDGLYDDNPHTNKDAKRIPYVQTIGQDIMDMAKGTVSKVGTGGMSSKIHAAKIVMDANIDMAIVSSNEKTGLLDVLEGKDIGTYFSSKLGRNLSLRNHWILYRSIPKGKLIVDDGCKKALLNLHTSLLSSGIVEVVGVFLQGQVVDIVDVQGNIIARGIVGYASHEIDLVKGRKSKEMQTILSTYVRGEIIHANDLVLMEGKHGTSN
ncbi:glutamate 5-kinase [Tannockella kyphosi]|uniref:glutamate 5-kinase n=1 Tax=Tannockella kyphosi TaxID=2899121 RepID=UPI00201251CA|nr:glutamate 5-kinase [Tannockella kyphosi]